MRQFMAGIAFFLLYLHLACVASWSTNIRDLPYSPYNSLVARHGSTPSSSWFDGVWNLFEPIIRWSKSAATTSSSSNHFDDSRNTRPIAARTSLRRPPQHRRPLPPVQFTTTDTPSSSTAAVIKAQPSRYVSVQNFVFRVPYQSLPARRPTTILPTIKANIPQRRPQNKQHNNNSSASSISLHHTDFDSIKFMPNPALNRHRQQQQQNTIPATQQPFPRRQQCSNRKQYARPVKCPRRYGFFQVGKSCYFISSLMARTSERLYTLEESQRQCSRLNDLSGQTFGDWHLVVINSVDEFNALSPAFDLATASDNADNKATQFLWIAQVRAAKSPNEARRRGSPYIYTQPCAGAAPYSVHVDTMPSQQLGELLRTPLGCNMAANVQDANARAIAPDCRQTRLNFACELDLDGDPSTFASSRPPPERRSGDDGRLSQRSALFGYSWPSYQMTAEWLPVFGHQ